VDLQVTSKVPILIRIKGSEGLILETNSTKNKEDHPIGLKIKGLAFMKGPLSWRIL